MKLLYARFKGLIGVCRASGLHEIYIDFTKCKHKLTLIIGRNGSGKSTIEDALHPFPDSASVYLPNEDGFKEIGYIDDEGTIYIVHIDYPVDKFLKRTSTKAYMQKEIDGVKTELNSNGNIGSYKDLLYTEFRLDSNFVSLSQLSVENRGLVDMTPAERKKFVGNIISSIEVYNDIYKNLNKRSSIFKSMINTIVAKIDTIGNEENLESTLNSITNRIQNLESQKNQYIKQLSDAESVIKISDPDGAIQSTFTRVYNQKKSVEEQIKTSQMFLNSLRESSLQTIKDSKELCEKEKIKIQNKINDNRNLISITESKLTDLLTRREEESNAISLKINRLNALTSEIDYDILVQRISTLKSNIGSYIKELNSIGLTPDTTLTKDEFEIGLNTLKQIKEQIDIIRSYNYDDEIETSIGYIIDGIDYMKMYDDTESAIEIAKSDYSTKSELYKYYEGLLDRISILDKRPSTCKDDSCSFISNALEAQQQEPKKKLKELEIELNIIQSSINDMNNRLETLKRVLRISSNIQVILRYVDSNKNILNKLPYPYSREYFLDGIAKGNTFNEIDNIYPAIASANILEYYKRDSEILIKLESEYKIYQSKNELIDEVQRDIDETNKKLNTTLEDITKYQNDLYGYREVLDKLDSINTKLDTVINIHNDIHILNIQKDDMNNQLNSISNNMKVIEDSIKNINNINSSLLNLDNDLKPLSDDRDKIKFSIDRLKEYKEELQIYKSKYDMIEILKKYSSPTKAGIQNLFIQVYMGQTLNMANKLLSMLFDGTLELKKYIINDKEFRIPCKSLESPIINDDISSCSTAQRCMISMILSFALLQQGSTKYNILRLDEIDGGLDQVNRSNFLTVLNKFIDNMDVKNCIMISHSSENVLDNVDLIILSPVSYDTPSGNIIFTYDDNMNER